MSTKRVGQIVDVMCKVRRIIMDVFEEHPDYAITREDIKNICIESFSYVATKDMITEGTVRDKCTRQLGINSQQFYDEVFEHLTGDNTLRKRINDAKDPDDVFDNINMLFI